MTTASIITVELSEKKKKTLPTIFPNLNSKILPTYDNRIQTFF